MRILRKHPVGRVVLLAFFVGVASLGACMLFRETWPKYEPYTTPGGVVVTDRTVTEGPAVAEGDTVEVHYVLSLEDGTVVDSTRERGRPLEYTLGTLTLPAGFEEGLIGLRVLGRREMRVPPEMGFGSEGLEGLVPPDAVLVFDVELLRIIDTEEGSAAGTEG
ncbi:MAG: FKBP-type peptidyl-prolyl cis-trans isomerase [Planctomycetota bacterium]